MREQQLQESKPACTMSYGILVLDTSCLKSLESEAARSVLRANARAAGWVVRVTAINALEVAQTGSAAIRERLRRTLHALAADTAVLAWPHVYLERAAEAHVAGQSRIAIALSHFDHLVDGPIGDEDSEKARQFLGEQTKAFEEMHASGRPQVQSFLRQHGLRSEWSSVRDYLDRFWMAPSHINSYVQGLWQHFEMAGAAPVPKLLATWPWVRYLEIHGAAAFERVITHRMPRSVHHTDWLQLMYLCVVRRGLIATDDEPFLNSARGYLGSCPQWQWAVHISELLT